MEGTLFRPTVSVLMAVYHRDDPHDFAAALDSLRPFAARLNAVVLVADGPLGTALEQVLAERTVALKIDLVRLPTSVGLGQALNAGLRHADSDFVLRMDSDDISRPNRLEVLLHRLAEDPATDVLGSFIAEFDNDPARPHAVRKVPLAHDDIARRMQMRCVMNHVSCMLRRQAVLDGGGYAGGSGFAEDWWLWARLISGGARFGNVDRVLVDVRVGNGFIRRRRGLRMLRQDWRLLKMMLEIGFIGRGQAATLLAIKVLQRLLPAPVLERVYAALRYSPSSVS